MAEVVNIGNKKGRIRTTRNQYLEQIARLLTGKGVVVTLSPSNASSVELGTTPVTIELPENLKYLNKLFLENSPNGSFDIEAIAKELGYSVPEFQLFLQRLMVYHESGHVNDTPAQTPLHPDQTMQYLVNLCEDSRVEMKMSNRYPPAKDRMDLLRRITLSRLDMKNLIKQTTNKHELAQIAGVVAQWYHYGLAKNQPKSEPIARMCEILDEIEHAPKGKMKFDKTEQYAKEMYDLIAGLTKEDLQDEMENCVGNGKSGLDNAILGEMEAQISKEMGDLEDDIKSFGIEMKNRDLRNLETTKYADQTLITHMSETLKRIMGGKPSRHNVIDFDGQQLDIEAYLDWASDTSREIKMYERSGKKERPELFITMCIDSSGSMSGGNVEMAKKSAINLAYACERVGIRSCIMDFATDTKIHKGFDMPICESEIGRLCADGGTDISVAIKESVKLMAKRNIPKGSKCAVIILSDGCDGTANKVAHYLNDNTHIHYYMIGIHDNPTNYVHEVRKGGAKCYGYAYVRETKELSKTMQTFVKDFVKYT